MENLKEAIELYLEEVPEVATEELVAEPSGGECTCYLYGH
jgi:predicted RNase H-like HicB family nuclease